MGRRNKGRAIHGMLLLNKGLNESSNEVLQQVKRLFGAAKAGHTGALDPLASGMLPICLGEATKFSQYLLDADKTYEVEATFGVRTTTSDADGEVVSEAPVCLTESQLLDAIQSFKGVGQQVPSMYSALKYQGKPLYWYARRGETIDRPAREITVFDYTLTSFTGSKATMRIHCSKGTYIRTLIDDLGQLLGCGAFVSKLHRVSVAQYAHQPMYTMAELRDLAPARDRDTPVESVNYSALDALLLPLEAAAMQLPKMVVDRQQGSRFLHGQSAICNVQCELGSHIRVYQQCEGTEQFIGVGEHIDKPRDRSPSLFDQHTFVTPKRLTVRDN
ncbi:tRNA pseudouridine(55) synthase TruB [Alteromonas oceanisediminis]|uniref:tRNA pseudouridine(55) synthase TruB n=1 Tax=Alteromonas oceanisediminis TaxID=2836180 RepID=UPI001BDB1A2F|nr:tRNA pseudouridine(55) synthase TruB [Alteromonas oceanisediminis]MBT0586617.1 tRNA pseudouridine(55) synthase TruB [Alteromonas oceanisediminis]